MSCSRSPSSILAWASPDLAARAVLSSALLDGGQVREAQLEVDDFAVADRIDRAHDVLDVVVLEAADDVHDGVHLADVGEELVAESFALAGALDQPGDVDELDRGGDGGLGFDQGGEGVEPGVGDGDDAGVGVDGGEGIVRDQRAGVGQGVEERRLADVRQSDDPKSEHRSVFASLAASCWLPAASCQLPAAACGETGAVVALNWLTASASVGCYRRVAKEALWPTIRRLKVWEKSHQAVLDVYVAHREVPRRGEIRAHRPAASHCALGSLEHRRGDGSTRRWRLQALSRPSPWARLTSSSTSSCLRGTSSSSPKPTTCELAKQVDEVGRMLNGLIAKLDRTDGKRQKTVRRSDRKRAA